MKIGGKKISAPKKLAAPKAANVALPKGKIKIGGYTQPKDPTGLTKKATFSNVGKLSQSVTGAKAKRNQESAAARDRAAEDEKIKKAMDDRPKFKSAADKDGNLKKAFKTADIKSNTATLDKKMSDAKALGESAAYKKSMAAADALRAEATATGDSPWATARKAEARALQGGANNAAAEEAGRGVKAGMAAMMAQGGAGGGSRERMLTQANRQNLMASQRNNAAANAQILGISADDAAQKAQLRQGLGAQYAGLDAAEMQRLDSNNSLAMNKAGAWGSLAAQEAAANQQASQQNADLSFKNNLADNEFDMAAYQERMAAMGAAATANAQAKGPRPAGGMFGWAQNI